MPVENHCLGASQVQGMCHFTSKHLENLSLFLWCQSAGNDPFWTKKVHGFPVRTPICHIVPISRIYRGGGGFGFFLKIPAEGGEGPRGGEGVCSELGDLWVGGGG